MNFETDHYFNYILLFWGPLALIAIYIAASLYRTVRSVNVLREELEVFRDQLTYLAEKIARVESQLPKKEAGQSAMTDTGRQRANSSSQPVRVAEVKSAETSSGVKKAAGPG